MQGPNAAEPRFIASHSVEKGQLQLELLPLNSSRLRSNLCFYDVRVSLSDIMSSMIKKKGTLSFKPKAPPSRRQPGAPLSAPSSTRQSIERQSQTPAPTARLAALSPPSALSQHREIIQEIPPLQDAPHVEEVVLAQTA